MPDNQEDAKLQALAQEFIQLAEASVFDPTAPDAASILSTLIKAKEPGLRAFFSLAASDKISHTQLQSILNLIGAKAYDLETFDENTGETAIQFLLETVLNSKFINARKIALALLAIMSSWIFPEKGERINNQLPGILLDESLAMRWAMIQYVGTHRIKAAVPYLITLLTNSEEYTFYIVEALKAINSPEALLAVEEWEKR